MFRPIGLYVVVPASEPMYDSRWFGNPFVVGQKELEKFREEVGKEAKDPYKVLMRAKKLPMALLTDPYQVRSLSVCLTRESDSRARFLACYGELTHATVLQNARMNLLSTESFKDTFGPKRVRKRPRLGTSYNDVPTLVQFAHKKDGESYSIACY